MAIRLWRSMLTSEVKRAAMSRMEMLPVVVDRSERDFTDHPIGRGLRANSVDVVLTQWHSSAKDQHRLRSPNFSEPALTLHTNGFVLQNRLVTQSLPPRFGTVYLTRGRALRLRV